jgi:hypothetical protein
VGPDFVRKCIETFYELTTYAFPCDTLIDIRMRLGTDNFRMSIKPVQHIRTCTVYFGEGHFSQYQLEASDAHFAKYTYLFETFLGPKQGSAQADFVIRTYRYGQFRSLYVLVLHLNLLVPLLYRYKDNGVKSRVFMASGYHSKVDERRDITFLRDMCLKELTDKVDEWGKTIGRFDRILISALILKRMPDDAAAADNIDYDRCTLEDLIRRRRRPRVPQDHAAESTGCTSVWVKSVLSTGRWR